MITKINLTLLSKATYLSIRNITWEITKLENSDVVQNNLYEYNSTHRKSKVYWNEMNSIHPHPSDPRHVIT